MSVKDITDWMLANGYATGHGETVADLLKEIEWQAKERVYKWHPMDTAPKTTMPQQCGDDILVVNDRGFAVVFWSEEDNWWIVQDHKHHDRPLRGSEPTHWRPLPNRPEKNA